MEEQNIETRNKKGFLEKASYYTLLIVSFLIPIFTIPFNSLPVSFDKRLLIILGTLVVFIFWLGSRLIDGKINLPKTALVKSGVFIILVTFISTLFSPSKGASFSGFGFESWTFLSLSGLFILTFLVMYYFQSAAKIFKFYLAIYWALVVLFFVQFINIFTPVTFLDLTSSSVTLVGRWGDMGMFFGLGLIISSVMVEMIKLEGLFKWLVRVVMTLSLLGVLLVNSGLVWWLLVIILGMFFVYRAVSHRGQEEGDSGLGFWSKLKAVVSIKKPFLTIIMISLVFGLFLQERAPLRIASVENALYSQVDKFVVPPLEARPTWKSTFSIASSALKDNLIVGSGPNRFARIWRLHKPDDINQSIFWNVDFVNAVGNIQTQVIATGLLGLLAWVLFLLLLFKTILVSLFKKNIEGPLASLLVVSGLATLYLWLLNILYVPQASLVALTFVVTGIYLAVLVKVNYIELSKKDMSHSSAFGFVSVLALILLVIASVSSIYLYADKALARGAFEKGRTVFASGDLNEGIRLLETATRKDEIDLYYRALVSAQLVDLSNFINSNTVPTDELQEQFVNKFGTVRDNAIRSTELDGTYFTNWLTLADVYELVAPIGVEGAHEAAMNAYNRAAEVAPNNPLIPLRMARLEFARGNNNEGNVLLEQSLALKGNYTDALFLKAQRAIQDGKLDEAIQSTLQAALINPNDVGVLFQLGFLYYRANIYDQAVLALERAVQLNPTYANARYFLALSYYNLDDAEQAVANMQIVADLNPDNSDVLQLLENLKSGGEPFAGEPVIPNPEESDVPPVEESQDSEE